MNLRYRPVGALETNCYLLWDETGAAALIDPGDEIAPARALAEGAGVTPRCILLTHGHYDHARAVPALCRLWPEADVYLHRADAAAQDGALFPLGAETKLTFYGEGDELALGTFSLRVLHTPGHSEGSVTLLAPGALFTGDTLFASSCGRTDLPGGDARAMFASLRRLALLPGDYAVYPGHGESSTLEAERRANPFLDAAVRRGTEI